MRRGLLMKTMVVKIGSSTLINNEGKLDRAYISQLADQAMQMRLIGWQLVIVSSGAVACGLDTLGISERPTDMPSLQAAASVGQISLASAYDEEFSLRGLSSSLVLLTRHDTANRHAYLHARDTMTRLLELGVTPIVNENDTTSIEEIRFGDNDTLAAVVSCLIQADLCVICSDIDGLYTANPQLDPSARLIECVERIDTDILGLAGDSTSSVGTGGMITKLKAARVLMTAGIPMVICHGHEQHQLINLAQGKSVGTRFVPQVESSDIAPRKLWIALGDQIHGTLFVDHGAYNALVNQGSSLLAVGIKRVQGSFVSGSLVDIVDNTGFVFARGLVGASSDEIMLAAGRQQNEIDANRLLVELTHRSVVRRDDMVVFA